MSTRCQIGVYESKDVKIENYTTLFYQHCDGYPDGVLPVIVPFLKQFQEVRGMKDTEYLSAWLMWALIDGAVKHSLQSNSERLNENEKPYYPENGMNGLGYGICTDGFHGDIEYFYKIYPCAIEIYECHYSDKPENWKLVETVQIENKSKVTA